MPVYNQTKMCGECPFRKAAPRGWLGPWTAEEIAQLIQGDQPFICHKDINRLKAMNIDIDDPIEREVAMQIGEHCVGALRYMSKCIKLSRDPARLDAQRRLRALPDQEVIGAHQFIEHHK